MGDGDLEQFGEFSGVPVLLNFFSVISGLLIILGVKLEIDPISDIESILLDIKLRVDPPCNLKSLTSEATHSATQFFKRSYKISHNPVL